MKKLIAIILLSVLVGGCSWITGAQVAAPKPPLLEADKIYSVPAGTVIKDIYLDGKNIGPRTFPFDMKVVAPNVLLEQEEKLNKALFAKIKTDEKNSTMTKILGGILGLLATVGTAWAVSAVKQKFIK